jgi:hypothetical protein
LTRDPEDLDRLFSRSSILRRLFLPVSTPSECATANIAPEYKGQKLVVDHRCNRESSDWSVFYAAIASVVNFVLCPMKMVAIGLFVGPWQSDQTAIFPQYST